MRFLRENWFLKFGSLIAAVILSLYVRGQFNEESRTFLLPVQFPALAGQRVVEPTPGTQIRIEVRGPVELLRDIESDSFAVKIDWGGVRPGRRVSTPVEVTLPPRFGPVQVDWRPKLLGVRTISDATKRLPVEIRPLSRSPEWEWREMPTAYPAQVDVSGTQQEVDRVVKVVAQLNVPGADRISEEVPLRALDAQGREIPAEQVRIDPPQTLVKGVQERVVLRKEVPVQPTLELATGVRVAGVKVQPARVRIQGPMDQASEVFLVETLPVRVPAQPATTQVSVGLRPPRPGVSITPEAVTVTVRLQPPARPPR